MEGHPKVKSVSFEELLISQVAQQEALTKLFVEKGIFTREEFPGDGEGSRSEDGIGENSRIAEGGYMRPISIVVLMIGVFLLGVSSCATAPTKPLAPGEVRLLSMVVPEKEKIRVNLPFVVGISFEADGQPEIKTACFYFAGDGPHCFKVTDVDYGPPGTIKVQIYSKNPGSRLLECYVLYIRDGKNQPTNVVSTYFRPVPQ